MEEGLFHRYNNQIKKQKSEKFEVISIIKEISGIDLDEKSITVSNKEIKINTSSVLKQKIFQKKVSELLKQKGFILK